MRTTLRVAVLCLLTVFGSWLCLAAVGADPRKPTLNRTMLLEAVEKIREGDSAVFSSLRQELARRPDTIILPSELLPEFVALLQDDKPQLQVLGAQGLYILKAPASKEALVTYLKKNDCRKLEKLVVDREMDERSYDYVMRALSLVILTLGELGDKSVIPLLEPLKGVRDLKFEFGGGAVYEALAKLGAEGIHALCRLGPDAGSQEVMAAHRAVRGVRDVKQVPALVATAKDGGCNESIRVAALGALGDMRGADTLPFLVSVAGDSEYSLTAR